MKKQRPWGWLIVIGFLLVVIAVHSADEHYYNKNFHAHSKDCEPVTSEETIP